MSGYALPRYWRECDIGWLVAEEHNEVAISKMPSWMLLTAIVPSDTGGYLLAQSVHSQSICLLPCAEYLNPISTVGTYRER